MKAVPWWFQTVAHVFAIVFALWVGVHIHAPAEWVVLYTLAALVSAVLPAYRLAGFVGLGVGILIGGVGAYLLRDVWKVMSISSLVDFKGGIAGGGREALMLTVAGLWLVAGSAFRTQRA